MSPRVEARLEKVKRTSRSARRACFWMMVFVGVAAAVTVATRLTIAEAFTCENGLTV